MKKIIVIAFSFLLFVVTSAAQEGGVKFQPIAGWKEVLAKAKKENKYIFVDCFATWCGPCKAMEKNIFPVKEVGDFINDKFIAVKVQMDKTKEDVPFIQNWYKDAKMIENDYSITAYPTYLVFSPGGEPLHRFVGGSRTPADFIAKTKDALEPATQYYKTVYEYKKHLRDSAFLRNAIKVALNASDRKMAEEIGNYYIDVINPMLKDNLWTVWQVTLSGKDKGFNIVMHNAARIDSIMGDRFAAGIAGGVMYEDDLKPYFEGGKETSDWNKLATDLKKKYPILDPQEIDNYEAAYYRAKKNIPAFEKALLAYVEKYNSRLSDGAFNQYAWAAFQLSDNKTLLEAALKWSERAVELVKKEPGSNYCNFMDTYANLFYKLGNKEEALKWEKKAAEVANRDGKGKVAIAIGENLAKMEKGDKTW